MTLLRDRLRRGWLVQSCEIRLVSSCWGSTDTRPRRPSTAPLQTWANQAAVTPVVSAHNLSTLSRNTLRLKIPPACMGHLALFHCPFPSFVLHGTVEWKNGGAESECLFSSVTLFELSLFTVASPCTWLAIHSLHLTPFPDRSPNRAPPVGANFNRSTEDLRSKQAGNYGRLRESPSFPVLLLSLPLTQPPTHSLAFMTFLIDFLVPFVPSYLLCSDNSPV